MLAIRNLLRTNPQVIRNVVQQRNMSVIATPPRVKVTGAEIVVLSAVMMTSWLAIPAWVLVNIKHYRGLA